MPFGLQMLGSVRGDEGLLASAKALETLFASDPEMKRPCPDVANLAQSDIDLKSIVTHPPILDSSAQFETISVGTAV
jgi:hypothetical protein